MIEHYSRVCADELRCIGLFEPDNHNKPFIFKVGPTQFLFKNNVTGKYVTALNTSRSEDDIQVFGVRYAENIIGKRAYFVDPDSGKSILHLYLIDGKLLTNEQSGCAYGSRGGKARRNIARTRRLSMRLTGDAGTLKQPSGAYKRALIDEILRRGLLENMPPNIQNIILRHQRRRARRVPIVDIDRGPADANDMRTSAAAARHRLAPGDYVSPWSVHAILKYAIETGKVARSGHPHQQPLRDPVGLTEHHGRLDMRELVQLWDGQSKYWSRALKFPNEAPNSFWFVCVGGRLEQSQLWVQPRKGTGIGEASGPVQLIELVRTTHAKPRWNLQCPVLQKPCEILYLRGGRFASRQAQRLVHPSQRAS
ncbi:MAG: hypothetical protein Q8M88_13975 [Phenylobacterium sp.]|uniref:hypothetical protein n=1 Tax=Phenylobacterium sp. TaxID=1871053 RepID=UPI0027362A93|nr:hypothetical protein [Phenylobacterium sp.]MDP3175535.1 hypothetical protein [Phenylobacterium sp.]